MKVTYIDHCGSDLTTVNAARVSFDKVSNGETIEYDIFRDDPDVIKASVAKYKDEGWVVSSDVENWKLIITKPTMKDNKLINFLAREGHTSPFNHTFITMHIKAPIFVARQLVKHKFMPWNEMSGRYVTFEPEFHRPEAYRAKAYDKKQGSGEPIKDTTNLNLLFDDNHHDCFRRYEAALAEGLCEEQARALLPLDLMTQWYWSGTLGAWASMYNLRAKPDTQKETQEIAFSAGRILANLYPVSWKALTNKDYG